MNNFRQGNSMKRGRNQRRRQGVNINRALDSNGPDVRIRGTANQIYDKYLALARDATSSGDRVKAENYLQHAEHYFRLIRSLQPAMPAPTSDVDADGDQPMIADQQNGQRSPDQPREERVGSGEDDEERPVEDPQPNGNGFDETRDASRQQQGPRHDNDRRGRRRRPRRPQDGNEGADEREEPVADPVN